MNYNLTKRPRNLLLKKRQKLSKRLKNNTPPRNRKRKIVRTKRKWKSKIPMSGFGKRKRRIKKRNKKKMLLRRNRKKPSNKWILKLMLKKKKSVNSNLTEKIKRKKNFRKMLRRLSNKNKNLKSNQKDSSTNKIVEAVATMKVVKMNKIAHPSKCRVKTTTQMIKMKSLLSQQKNLRMSRFRSLKPCRKKTNADKRNKPKNSLNLMKVHIRTPQHAHMNGKNLHKKAVRKQASKRVILL